MKCDLFTKVTEHQYIIIKMAPFSILIVYCATNTKKWEMIIYVHLAYFCMKAQ